MISRDKFEHILSWRSSGVCRRDVAACCGIPVRMLCSIEAAALWAEREGVDAWAVFLEFHQRGLFPFDPDGELL